MENQEMNGSAKEKTAPAAQNTPGGTNSRRRFVDVARVVTSSQNNSWVKIVALKSPPGQLTLAAAKKSASLLELIIAVLLFPLLLVTGLTFLYTVRMTVKCDEAGNPADTRFRIGPELSAGGRIVTGFGVLVAICVIGGLIVLTIACLAEQLLHGLLMAALTVFVLLAFGVGILIDFWLRKRKLRDRFEAIVKMLPQQAEFVLPEHSSFDFGGKSAAEIAAEFLSRTAGAADFTSDPETISQYLRNNRKLAAVDPQECIFLAGTANDYNLLTTRGVFLCRKLGWWNCWEYTYRDIVGINVENNFVILREKDKVYSCTHLLTHAVPPKSGNMRPLMLDFIRGMQERG